MVRIRCLCLLLLSDCSTRVAHGIGFLKEVSGARATTSLDHDRSHPNRGAASTPQAAIFAEAGDYPGGAKQSVELFRYVTAYRTGIDAVVDITAFTPLLRAAAGDEGSVQFYSFIQTWVGNDTEGTRVLSLNETTQVCSKEKIFHGNGWSLDAELLLWPAPEVDTRPHRAVTVATGTFGSSYPIGEVTMHEGTIQDGSQVLLEQEVDLNGATQAQVYHCPSGAGALKGNALIGYLAREVQSFARKEDKEGYEQFTDDMYTMLAESYIAALEVDMDSVDNGTRSLKASFKVEQVNLKKGDPVYFAPSQVFVQRNLSSRFSTQVPYPFQPIGVVSAVKGDMATVELQTGCLPSEELANLPQFYVPISRTALPDLMDIVNATKRLGVRAAEGHKAMKTVSAAQLSNMSDATEWVVPFAETGESLPLLLHVGSEFDLAPVDSLGVLSLESFGPTKSATLIQQAPLAGLLQQASGNTTGSTVAAKTGDKVCVIAERQHGRIFQRSFDMDELVSSDAVLMQMVVTGHGWASTTDQCGEYCHAVYRMSLNGKSVANVTQWRDDCDENPLGDLQKGTWFESRNGWCPGSVEPGIYVDMSKHMRSGENNVVVDLVVWNNVTESYEPYTDYGGFALDDHAKLSIGMSFFVYSSAATAAVRGQERALTAAEAAIREGCSKPDALAPPAHPSPPKEGVTLLAAGKATVTPRTKRGAARSVSLMSTRLPQLSPAEDEQGPRGQPPVFASADDSMQDEFADKQDTGSLLQETKADIRAHSADRSTGAKKTTYDIEKTAPWYFYNESTDELGAAKRLQIFSGKLVQTNSQVSLAKLKHAILKETKGWGQAAIRLRLSKPPGLHIDHWDREASFGLVFAQGSENIRIHQDKSAPMRSDFAWTSSETGLAMAF